MSYIIDIITGGHRATSIKSCEAAVRRLRNTDGFESCAIFTLERNLRDAHYDHLVVYTFHNGHDRQRAAGSGLLPPVDSDSPIERTFCKLENRLGELREQAAGDIWLINPFEITDAEIPGVLDMWDKAKDHMIAKPGFISARLFRVENRSSRYGLVNVAHWRSADLFMQALNDKAYDVHRAKSQNYKLHPSLCTLEKMYLGEVAAFG